MADRPDICVVRKTYSGQEGERVKAGTRFAVGKEKGGLPVMSNARYLALLERKIVRPFSAEDGKAAPSAAPLEPATITTLQGPSGPGPRAKRQAARNRLKQDDNPPAPTKKADPAGSQTGKAAPSSSSPEGQAPGPSTSTRRGTRPSASSPSTTPGR